VPNEQGYARFRAAGGIETAAVFPSASETHTRKNELQHRGAPSRDPPVAERARGTAGLRAYVCRDGCRGRGRSRSVR
jgi:hypothetical protein